MIYNQVIQECFFDPKHVGVIDDAAPRVVCIKKKYQAHVYLELYLRLDVARVIQRICFKTNGNPYLISGMEWVCRSWEGRILGNDFVIDYRELIQLMDIPTEYYPAALQIQSVFKEAVQAALSQTN